MAYASLVCLVNTLDENIELNLIPQNSQYIQTLLQEATFFQKFLEKTSHKSSGKRKRLETRIRDAAFKAQDIIDSHVANRLDESVEPGVDFGWDECLFQDLDEVMEEINSIKLEAVHEEEDNAEEPDINQPSISAPAGSSRPSSHGMTTNTIVGLEDQLQEIKTRLVSGSPQREIVALVGMGGIGKTTLARKVYDDKFIVSHFDTRRWSTVSQEYGMQNILAELLGDGKMSQENNENLELDLYQSLKQRRYLIVLDDMWDTQVWDKLKRILVDDKNGSRILLTTRLKKAAKYDNNCSPHHMRFLNDEESWDLFCEKVFGHDCCPLELENVGKEIVQNCRGLPLEVNLIGGHLSKATRTPSYWRRVAMNLSETVVLEDEEQCSRVLSLSYNSLPNHLKGCFLYMSIFPEDYKIDVSDLVHLWIACGLIKQESSKSFEDAANDYFLDLVERNLILISKCKYNGKIQSCKIHDLVRDLCVKEAKSEKLFHLIDKTLHRNHLDSRRVRPHSRPLRALYWETSRIRLRLTLGNQLSNMRFLFSLFGPALSIRKFLHLHTIHVFLESITLNIWEMPQLRHVKSPKLVVPDPPAAKIGGNSVIVLGKLQTLQHVSSLIFKDEVLQRIQNIKKLGVQYVHPNLTELGLKNLDRLSKLESLRCRFIGLETRVDDMSFPHSIKKLTLLGSKLPWKDMTQRVIGSLPNLQVLSLEYESFVGEEWEPNEGEFLNLKTLRLHDLNLVHWRAEAVHFPMLQHLFIDDCTNLLEIPSGVGEIATLQLIEVNLCRKSVLSSARRIVEEQHDFGNEGLRLITNDNILEEESTHSFDSQEAPSEEESTDIPY